MLNSPIDEIKNRLDIVEVIGSYIKLQKAGANYRAVCPFHSEKKPSFFISPSRQIWHCFGACSAGGDIFKFVMKIEGVEFPEALRILAQKAGVELKKEDPKIKSEKQRISEILELSCCFFEKQLEQSKTGGLVKEYLFKRGIKEQSVKEWRIGYAPDAWQGLSDFLVGKGYNRQEVLKAGLGVKSEKGYDHYDRFRGRIMFPVFDLSSRIVGFGGRIFESSEKKTVKLEGAKYVNTPNTLLYNKSNILYGLNKAGMEIRKRDFCLLVEGYIDAVMVWQSGFENVVATSGTALTDFQLNILKRYTDKIYTAFDMDLAGNSATARSISLAQSLGFTVKVVAMPKGSDPADIILRSSEEWENLVSDAKSIHNFYFENIISDFDRNTIEGKKEISKIILPVIKRISNRIERTVWIQSLARILKVREEDIIEELQKQKQDFDIGFRGNSIPAQKQEEKKPFRKELLEEHLLVLVLAEPKNLSLLEKEDISLFVSQTCHAIDYLKKNKNIGKNIPAEISDIINCVSLKAEIIKQETPNFDFCAEFKNCLKEIKTLSIREKLNKICLDIKEAEINKNENEMKRLLDEFNSLSRTWRKIEES